jgi:hypothetical protein
VSSIGTLAITENSATSRTCSRPLPPIAVRAARRIATRRPISTNSATQGSKLAISSSATTGGVSSRSSVSWPMTMK